MLSPQVPRCAHLMYDDLPAARLSRTNSLRLNWTGMTVLLSVNIDFQQNLNRIFSDSSKWKVIVSFKQSKSPFVGFDPSWLKVVKHFKYNGDVLFFALS